MIGNLKIVEHMYIYTHTYIYGSNFKVHSIILVSYFKLIVLLSNTWIYTFLPVLYISLFLCCFLFLKRLIYRPKINWVDKVLKLVGFETGKKILCVNTPWAEGSSYTAPNHVFSCLARYWANRHLRLGAGKCLSYL